MDQSETIRAFLPYVMLLVGVGVAAAVYVEDGEFPTDVRTKAHMVLVWFLVIEAGLGLLLTWSDNAEIAGLRGTTATLSAKAAGRHIGPNERDRLISALVPFKGQQVGLAVAMGDSESLRFADELVEALRSAGWKIDGTGIAQIVYAGAPPTGISFVIAGPPDDLSQVAGPTIPTALNSLALELNRAGFLKLPASVRLDPKAAKLGIGIVVGTQP